MARTQPKTKSKAKKPAAKDASKPKKPAKPQDEKKAAPDKKKDKEKEPAKKEAAKKVEAPAATASMSARGAAAKAPAPKASKPARARGEHDEWGDDGDDDEDFAMPKPATKPGKAAAGKKATPPPIDIVDDDEGVALDDAFAEDEEEDFGGAPKPRSTRAEADAAAMEAESRASKKSGRGGNAQGGRDGNTMRDKLIELGKQKGFVTYDEVNDHMPDDVVSTDQIDGWLSALGEHGIEVVDSSGSRRNELVDQAPKGLDIEKEKEEEIDEDEEYAYSRTSDPVRMYLRKMGSVSLLTREGEVEIAKRIEDGERKMLQAVLNSSVAVEELLEIGERLRKGKIRVKDVVKDIDEDEAEFNEQFYVDRVCKIIERSASCSATPRSSTRS